MRTPLQKQQSLPLRPIIPLVARISDQNASGAPPMTVREKTRLEKFRQLLSSHNTDLGEWHNGCPWVGRQREACCLCETWFTIYSRLEKMICVLADGNLFQQVPVSGLFLVTGGCWALHEN